MSNFKNKYASLKLKKHAEDNAVDNVLNEEEEPKPSGGFIPKKDEIVSDIDGYYLVRFLEQEFGKKDLGGIFKRRNGKAYNRGYVNNVRDGKKGVTEEFLAAVKDFYPNIEQDLANFMQDVVHGEADLTEDQQAQQHEMKTRQENKQRLIDLKNQTIEPQTGFARFLMDITKLNLAQIQDALKVDPNQFTLADDGRKRIPGALVEKAKELIGFSNDDLKAYKADKSFAANYTNDKIKALTVQYRTASVSKFLNRLNAIRKAKRSN